VAFETRQANKGIGLMATGGCGCSVAIIGAIVGIFLVGFEGALGWLIVVGGISAFIMYLGAKSKEAGENAVARRRSSLTPEQREAEAQQKAEYQQAAGIAVSAEEQARARNENAAIDSRVAAMQSPLRTRSGQLARLYAQNALLMSDSRFRSLGGNLTLRLNDAELQMHEAEQVAFIAGAETNIMRKNVIVVTTARLAVVNSGGVEWTPLVGVTSAGARPTVMQNNCELNIYTRGRHYRWPVVEPKSIGFDMAKALGPGKPPLTAMTELDHRGIVARSDGKYAGGTLSLPGTQTPLADNAEVQVVLADDDVIRVVCDGLVVAEASATDPGIMIDTTETVGRSLKAGPAVLVAGSALLLGPLALLATPLAIGKQQVKQHLVLAMSVGPSNAVIALDDTGAAIRMRAATANAVGEPDIAPQVEPDVDGASSVPAGTGTSSTLSELERLKGLHDSGVLSDDEFVVLKQRILGLGEGSH
jgi:hypothetical protein